MINAAAATGPMPGIDRTISMRRSRAGSDAMRRPSSAERGLAGRTPIGQSRPIGDRGRACPDELLQRLERFRRGRGCCRLEAFGEDREEACIEPIRFGQLADGFGKQARAPRIDDGHGETRGAEDAVRLAVVFGGGLHDDGHDRASGEAAPEVPEAVRRVGDAELMANRVEKNVEPGFTDVDADVDSRCALFGRNLALYAGPAPCHLSRTSAKDGRTRLTRGSCLGVHGPARPAFGGGHPRRPARTFRDSGQGEHARGLVPAYPSSLEDAAGRKPNAGPHR